MKPERYQQVKHLFQSALELDTGARQALLDSACGSDVSLRDEVERMLAAHEQAASFIEAPALPRAAPRLAGAAATAIEGRAIGPYQIIREIGHGGMGAVYLAARADDQYHKQVAIKLIRRGLDTQEIVRRFIGERQILANLDHPHIARLYDGGTTPDGLPYIVMEFMEGLPVLARQDTFGYRAAKFIRRNKGLAAAAALVALTLIAGIVATAWQARRAAEQSRMATEQRDRARLEQTKAQRINAFLQQMLAYANPSWYAPGKGKRRDLTVLEALDEAAHRIDQELTDQPEIKAELHTTIGDTYRALGRLQSAEAHFTAALELRRALFGDRHVKVAESLYYLGGVKSLQGDWQMGEQLYRDALAIQRAMPNEGNNLPYMLLDLGNLLLTKGDTQAAALFGEALEIFRGKYGEAHTTVAIAREYLGMAYQERGDDERAQDEFEAALGVYEQTPGSMAAVSLLRLGEIHISRRQYQEGEALIRRALDQYARRYGEKHFLALGARNYLVYLALERGDYRTAKREIGESLRIARQVPAEERSEPHIGEAFAAVLNKTGQPARAEPYLREALRAHSRQLPNTSLSVAETKAALGECLMEQKRYAEAEGWLLQSYESLKASQVAQSPRLKTALNRLVRLYDTWRKPELAAPYRTALSAPPS